MNKEILKHVVRYILMILIIIVCCKIYHFSSETGTSSSERSGKVAKAIVMMSKENKNLSEEKIAKKVETIQPIVRKTAHFSVYMLLGLLLMCCSETFKGKNIIKFDISIILAFLYACSDELHQLLIQGRSGEFRDVSIDTTGALLGILIILLVSIIIQKIRERNKKNIKSLAENFDKDVKKRSVIFIASTGGHLNELMQVKVLFNKYNYHIITERNKVDKSLKKDYGRRMSFLIYGTKKYPIKYFFKFLANCFISLYYYFKFQPEVIVTTGTHTAVPMCYIGKIFGSKVIFIETFANRTSGTVSGKLVYPIADTFVVQWEEMEKIYPKAVCWGWIY